MTAAQVKLKPIWRGCDLAKELMLSPVHIESDCKAKVERINSTGEDFSPLGHFVNALKTEFREYSHVRSVYAGRKSNILVHLLGQHALVLEDFSFDGGSSTLCNLSTFS